MGISTTEMSGQDNSSPSFMAPPQTNSSAMTNGTTSSKNNQATKSNSLTNGTNSNGDSKKPSLQNGSSSVVKKESKNNNNSSNGSSPTAEGKASKPNADVSSEDIDVTATSPSPQRNSMSKTLQQMQNGGDAATVKTEEPGSSNSIEESVKSEAEATVRAPPEKDLVEKLKRVRLHVIGPLFKHSKSNPFRQPVDAKALGIWPIYHQIITHPMDLGTVRKKIDRKEYNTRQECLDDIRLVWSNALLFNKPGHLIYEQAAALKKVTEEKIAKLFRMEAEGAFAKPVAPKTPGAAGGLSSLPPPAHRTPLTGAQGDRGGDRKRTAALHASMSLAGAAGADGEFDFSANTAATAARMKFEPDDIPAMMRQCEEIFHDWTTMEGNSRFLDPFRSRGSDDLMDLDKVEQRLQLKYYTHPAAFANDVRRIVTETYKNASDPDEPICALAGELQHSFELRFCRVNYNPVDNPAILDSLKPAGLVRRAVDNNEDDMISQLLAAQQQMLALQENMNILVQDYFKMRNVGLVGKRPSRRKPPPPFQSSSVDFGQSSSSNNNRKRGRPGGGGGPTPGNTTKRQRTSTAIAPPPPPAFNSSGEDTAGAQRDQHHLPPHHDQQQQQQQNSQVLSMEESIALREQVAELGEDEQQRIVEIMMANQEQLATDENGYTEIDLSNCGAVTIRQIQEYIRHIKADSGVSEEQLRNLPPDEQPPVAADHQTMPASQQQSKKKKKKKSESPKKSKQNNSSSKSGGGNLTDSSDSESGSDSDSSSSSSSSDSESD